MPIRLLLLLPLTATLTLAADFHPQGAARDGTTLDTQPIQQAIERASASGGGRVVLTKGTYLITPIRLLDGVELHLEKDAVLLASPNLAHYPDWPHLRAIANPKALPRQRNACLILADQAHNIALTGEGTIDANGHHHVKPKPKGWTGWQYERKVPITNSLPRILFLAGCSNITIRGITIRNPPAGWSCLIHDCDQVLIENADILADVRYPNNDGYHINSSRDVLIRNCHIETGDDSIIVRANNRSLAQNKICERITVSNCTLRSYSAAIRLGWTNDGTIRNCLFRDIKIHDTSVGISFELPRVGGWNTYDYGREATRFENLRFENIDMDAIYGRPILITIERPELGTRCDGFYNIEFHNLHAKTLEPPLIRARPDCPITQLRLRNTTFTILPDDQLPGDYTHHGAALWNRKHGTPNAHYTPDIR